MLRAALSLALCVPFASADDRAKTLPAPKTADLKPLDEVWEAAYVLTEGGKDAKIGHIHLTSVPIDKHGVRVIRTTKELRFEVGRGGSKAEMKADVSTDEAAGGKVRAINAKLWLGRDRVQNLNCEIIDDAKIVVSAAGEFNSKGEFRWDPACLGLAGEQKLLRDRKVKAGDTLTYRYFEPQVANYVRVQIAVGDKEKVTVPGSAARDLLKVVATPEPLTIKATGQKLQMPAATYWVDPVTYDTVKTVMEVPEIGKVTLLRTSRLAALAPNGDVPDLMKRQSIFLKAAVPDMHERGNVVYRVSFNGDAQPKDLVSTDARQAIKNANGKTFELHVLARRAPAKVEVADKIGPEFLRSNYFINSDDAEVKKLAARAVGAETDPWKKAQAIERFVSGFMIVANFTEAMAPADHVAKTRTGDCTEYAMLTAAMCRAEKIPSRTAIGLVYVNNLLGKPGLAFHMWTEVFVAGQWLALDATLGRGSVGPGHLKITDASWHDEKSFAPLLPVLTVLSAQPQVEVLRVTGR
ncbi:MAG TPA: transglutaminase family protein [Gemmataceae bacterium]|nr:transglutaminase family protein [Gemmataceae bacterium]